MDIINFAVTQRTSKPVAKTKATGILRINELQVSSVMLNLK